MKENKLTIIINKSISEVFDFTINPSNTPSWIDSIVEEFVDAEEIKTGTKYTNIDRVSLSKNYYIVTKFEKDKLFELSSLVSDYHVRYSYKTIGENKTELEYFEWDTVNLTNPLVIETLEKLKDLIENR